MNALYFCVANLSPHYNVIREVAEEQGFKITYDENIDADILWHDISINPTVFSRMRNY